MGRGCLPVFHRIVNALAAAELCREHKLATADAIVYATALAHNASVLTCDADFKTLPNVILIEKPQ